jgi:glycine/D-amino acid oxidase-like deaminating enzyme
MIAVIGTGVVGACVGYYLAREGAEILLVDAGRPGVLTTGASLAWVNASSKADRPGYFELNAAGLAEYEHLADALGGTWWHPTGHLRWDYRDETALLAHVERLRARGYPAEVWEAERVRRLLEPDLAFPSPSALVAVFPSEGWVEGPQMVQALIAGAVKNGATTSFENSVRNIGVADGTVASIELAGGQTYQTETVVNAAGPGASGVAALVGRHLPMTTPPGLAVRVRTDTDLVRRVIHPPDIAIRPDRDGLAFLLARGIEPELARAELPLSHLIENVRQLAGRVVPELAGAPVVDARIGQRPIPFDGLPAVGKATAVDGYYEAITHSGITLGPILARALTAEILHGEIDPLVAGYRASRPR